MQGKLKFAEPLEKKIDRIKTIQIMNIAIAISANFQTHKKQMARQHCRKEAHVYF